MNAREDSSSTNPYVANFVVGEEWKDGVAIVAATGAIDMLTAPALADGIRVALGKKPRAVIIDLTDVDFLASAGMQVLIAANEESGPDARLIVVADGPATSRPLKITGITEFIDVYPSRDEALEDLTV